MAVSTSTANDLMVVFSDTISHGFAALAGPVNGVFGTMITLVVGLTGIQWALSPNRELLAGAVGKLLLIGAFAWLINDWQVLSETIYQGFLQLGLTAGGGGTSQDDFFNPGKVLEQGWKLVKSIGDIKTPGTKPLDIARHLTDAVILAIAMIGIMLAFAILALQIVVALIEFKIVTLGGFVLLPFGIWSKSAFLAERPLGYVVSAGLKVLALAIVVSGANAVFSKLVPSAEPDIYEALSILTASILLAMLALFIPNLASSLITGGPSLGAGSMLTSALAVGGGAALAASAVTRIGGAAAGSGIARSTQAAAGAGSGRPLPSPPSSPAAAFPPSNRPGGPGSATGKGPSSRATPAQTTAGSGSAQRKPAIGGAGAAGQPEHGASAQVETISFSSARAFRAYRAANNAEAVPAASGQSAPATEARSGAGTATGSEIPATASTTTPPRDPSAPPPTGAGETSTRPVPRATPPVGASSARVSGVTRQPPRRSFQAYWAANAGRQLLPANENTGSLHPDLKREES